MNLRPMAAAMLCLLAGCSLPHGNVGMPDMSGGPGFSSSDVNDKTYDPNPHSASDDAQAAAYKQHQQDQMNAAAAASGPDLSTMSCSGSSVSSSSANAGSFSSSTSCHN
jgi:hypothetical protein